jgi:hypothetical protein
MITDTGEILLNHVSPDARFRGVSKGIIAGLEARADALGLGAVTLQSSTTARRFYLAAGYTSLGPPTKAFGITLCHPMAKRLRLAVTVEIGSDPRAGAEVAENIGAASTSVAEHLA